MRQRRGQTLPHLFPVLVGLLICDNGIFMVDLHFPMSSQPVGGTPDESICCYPSG